MDFALSDSAEGRAFLDNNSGMEYHIDTSGSSVPQPALDVVHIAVEMAPIAKVESPFLHLFRQNRCMTYTLIAS